MKLENFFGIGGKYSKELEIKKDYAELRNLDCYSGFIFMNPLDGQLKEFSLIPNCRCVTANPEQSITPFEEKGQEHRQSEPLPVQEPQMDKRSPIKPQMAIGASATGGYTELKVVENNGHSVEEKVVAHNGESCNVKVKFVKNVENSWITSDGHVFGPYFEGDVVELPKTEAEWAIKNSLAIEHAIT